MRLEQLAYLIEIQKNSSLSNAAQQLHLSVQALSKSIVNMEEELGYILLNRTSKGVSLTEQAKQLVRATEHFFEEMTAIAQKPQMTQPDLRGEYSVYSILGEVNYFLLTLLASLSREFPHLEVNIIRHSPAECSCAVK